MRFKVIITYDHEYNGYVVDVPELVGCMSQGKTIDEALNNIKDAIKGWMEVGKTPPYQSLIIKNWPLVYCAV